MASGKKLGLGLVLVVLFFGTIAGATWVNRTQRSENGLITEVEVSRRPVRVTEVGPVDLTEILETTGLLLPNRDVMITAEVAGKVQRVYKELGDPCKSGELLVKLDGEGYQIALAQARAQVQQAEVALDHARRDLQRIEQLREEAAVAPQQLDTMEGAARTAAASLEQARAGQQAAERSLRETRITCPFSGHVAERMVEVGQMVDPRTPLARLVDVGRLKLSLSVTGDQLARIRLGQEVTLVDTARPLERFTGTVSRLGVAAEESTRTFPVEVLVEQDSVGLRAGQVVRSSLSLGDYRGVLAVPVDAIQQDGEQPSVFVVREGRARRVPVRTGAQVRNRVIIESGLSAGDRVVAVGSDALQDGVEVMVMGSSAAGAGAVTVSDPGGEPPPGGEEP